MTKKESAKRKANEVLDVAKVMEDFQRDEKSLPHRKDAFKIEKPFDAALNTILKVRSHTKRKRTGKSEAEADHG